MKLITETIESVKYLTEASENGKKKLYIEGTFLVGEQVNKEGNYGYRDEPGAPADKEKEKWKGQIQQCN